MQGNQIRDEIRQWPSIRIIGGGLIFGVLFAVVGSIFDPGWSKFGIRLVLAVVISVVYLFGIKYIPGSDALFVLNRLSPTTIVAILGILMVAYGIIILNGGVIVLGCIPIVIALVVVLWGRWRS